MRKYHVQIDDRTFEIEVDESGNYRVDGQEAAFTFHPTGTSNALANLGERQYEVTLDRGGVSENDRVVWVNGRGIPLTIEDEKTALLKRFEGNESSGAKSNAIRSPMPGKINRILISEGDEILAGQGVLILEAMKMENEIKAPSAGVVSRVCIKESDAVDKNELLIELS